MSVCRYCKNMIKDSESFCQYCGYDPKTDTMSKDFKSMRELGITPKKKIKKDKYDDRGIVSPGVKKFAFIGLAILIFSIFYKNHFNISNVISEVKYLCSNIMRGKFPMFESQKKKSSKKIEWIDVRTFEEDKR